MLVDILGVLVFAFAVVAATEGISWLWVYKNEDYRRLVSQVDKFSKMVTEKKNAAATSVTATTTSTSTKSSKEAKSNKKIARAEDQLKQMGTQLASYNLKTAAVNVATVLTGYQMLNARYDGVVVAKLPFTPFSFFTGITHRGLAGEDYTEASAHLLFALGLMIFRLNLQKWMEEVALKPRTPQQLSIWEMANSEAEKMQQSVQ